MNESPFQERKGGRTEVVLPRLIRLQAELNECSTYRTCEIGHLLLSPVHEVRNALPRVTSPDVSTYRAAQNQPPLFTLLKSPTKVS